MCHRIKLKAKVVHIVTVRVSIADSDWLTNRTSILNLPCKEGFLVAQFLEQILEMAED